MPTVRELLRKADEILSPSASADLVGPNAPLARWRRKVMALSRRVISEARETDAPVPSDIDEATRLEQREYDELLGEFRRLAKQARGK